MSALPQWLREALEGVVLGFGSTVALLVSAIIYSVTTYTPWAVDVALIVMAVFFASLSVATGAMAAFTFGSAWKVRK